MPRASHVAASAPAASLNASPATSPTGQTSSNTFANAAATASLVAGRPGPPDAAICSTTEVPPPPRSSRITALAVAGSLSKHIDAMSQPRPVGAGLVPRVKGAAPGWAASEAGSASARVYSGSMRSPSAVRETMRFSKSAPLRAFSTRAFHWSRLAWVNSAASVSSFCAAVMGAVMGVVS